METKLVSDGKNMYVYCDGLRVAKRGKPNTPHAKKWITLVAGYTVRESKDYRWLTVIVNSDIISRQ
jgi:hypothetical protein